MEWCDPMRCAVGRPAHNGLKVFKKMNDPRLASAATRGQNYNGRQRTIRMRRDGRSVRPGPNFLEVTLGSAYAPRSSLRRFCLNHVGPGNAVRFGESGAAVTGYERP